MVGYLQFRIHRQMAACVAAVLAVLFAMPRISAADVEAELDRDSVPAGSAARLAIRVSGGRAGRPEVPAVENLIVQPRGQSQQIQMTNGRTSVSVVYTYAVGSNTPGDYQIPPVEIDVDGQKLSTRPLKLKVLDSAAKAPAGLQQNPSAPQAGGDGEEGRFGFLTVELADSERKHAYVGEIAPVRIRAWLPADSRANLRSGIQPEGKAFTLHHVSDQPQQAYEIKDGKRYLVVTWYGGISATKAGKYPASLSVDATVAVRDTSAPQPRRRTGGPFDDPFFDNLFEDMNAPMIEKDVTLKSDDHEIEIRPLPKDGRPEGFTGAVGSFKLEGAEIPAEWRTGEPRQVRARLSGSGNFSLMKAPVPTPPELWKTYSGKDEFTPGDEASFSGSKVFEFSAVARKGGNFDAALEFSFFDPSAGAYKTITSPSRKVRVSGADLIDDPSPAAAAPPGPVRKEQALVAQRAELSPRGSLVPLVSRPAFAWLLGSGAMLCLSGGLIAWIRRARGNPERLARIALESATRDALRSAEVCAASGDVPGFFAAARLAIQQRLGALWNQPPQAVTLAEIRGRMPEDSPVARFFAEADRVSYSRDVGGSVLPEWRRVLDEAMSDLTPNRS